MPYYTVHRCRHPNGSVAIGDTPCYDIWGKAACCMEGYACLSNNICIATEESAVLQHGLYARGSCTDSTWTSDECLKICINSGAPDYDNVGRAQPIRKCYDDSNEKDMYYCNNHNVKSVNCSNQTNVFWFEDSNPKVPVTVISTLATPSTTASTSSSETITASAQTPFSTTTGSSSPTDYSAGPSSADDAEFEELESSKFSTGAIVGIVLGSVAFLACIGGLAFFLYRRWRRQEGEPLNPPPSSHPGPSEVYTADPSTAHHEVGGKVREGELYEVPGDESQRHELPG